MPDSIPIDSFTGGYRWLSNFCEHPLTYDGIEYASVEHAYQAAKSRDPKERDYIAEAPTPGEAKKRGRKATLRQNWEEVKDIVMLECLHKKFADPSLRSQLLDTGESPLIEGNYWGDTYWGVCRGVGQNRLGELLMQVRQEIRNELA